MSAGILQWAGCAVLACALAGVVPVEPVRAAPVVNPPELAALAPAPAPLPGEAPGGADAPSAQERAQEKSRREVAELCTLLMGAAKAHGVPPDFFIRLIWKESRFNAGAVSPVGAQGIAQFMPGTARLRGLKNPFDREEALFASASFLADMEAEFGSWGLAAIGYNGGPNRVMPLVRGRGGLPAETIDYVFSITGRTHGYWAERARRARGITLATPLGAAVPVPVSRAAARANDGAGSLGAQQDGPVPGSAPGATEDGAGDADGVALTLAALAAARAEAVREGRIPEALRVPAPRPDYTPKVDCPQLVARLGRQRDVAPPAGGGYTRWGAQVAGHPRRSVAMAQYRRLEGKLPGDLRARGPVVVVRRFAARGRLPVHAIMFAAASRSEAQALCKRIARALAPCVVVKNG